MKDEIEVIRQRDRIIEVRQKIEYWYEDGLKKSAIELVIRTFGSVMQFNLNDSRLPVDIEIHWRDYLLCYERFGEGKPSNTGITNVWFEKGHQEIVRAHQTDERMNDETILLNSLRVRLGYSLV